MSSIYQDLSGLYSRSRGQRGRGFAYQNYNANNARNASGAYNANNPPPPPSMRPPFATRGPGRRGNRSRRSSGGFAPNYEDARGRTQYGFQDTHRGDNANAGQPVGGYADRGRDSRSSSVAGSSSGRFTSGPFATGSSPARAVTGGQWDGSSSQTLPTHFDSSQVVGAEDHLLAFPPETYYPPEDCIDQADLPAGVGMTYNDQTCLICRKPLLPGHLNADGSCWHDCFTCGTSHEGKVCHRLWLSKVFHKSHGCRKTVPRNVRLRPSPKDCLLLIAMGHKFFATVHPLASKNDVPKRSAMPTQQLSEGHTAKRTRDTDLQRSDLEARLQEMERMRDDEARRARLAEESLREIQRLLEELQRRTDTGRRRSPSRE